jgi:predicted enzyme involved in methoxymalonyl-ACP biosynthesis
MELAMFDTLVEQCQARGIQKIIGVYVPSKKNGMVAQHYEKLGFTRGEMTSEGRQLWHFEIPSSYSSKTRFIRRTAIESRVG